MLSKPINSLITAILSFFIASLIVGCGKSSDTGSVEGPGVVRPSVSHAELEKDLNLLFDIEDSLYDEGVVFFVEGDTWDWEYYPGGDRTLAINALNSLVNQIKLVLDKYGKGFSLTGSTTNQPSSLNQNFISELEQKSHLSKALIQLLQGNQSFKVKNSGDKSQLDHPTQKTPSDVLK